MGRHWGVCAFLASWACSPSPNDGPGDDGNGATASEDGGTEEDDLGTDGGDGTDGSTQGTGSTGDSDPNPYNTCGTLDPDTGVMRPSADEYTAVCGSQTSRSACVSVPSCHSEYLQEHWCMWEGWISVAWDGEACVFGEVGGRCIAQSAGDGCDFDAGYDCGGSERRALVQDTDGSMAVVLGQWCFDIQADLVPCEFGPEGNLVSGPPECACVCHEDLRRTGAPTRVGARSGHRAAEHEG
jgi:hypothetical protein